MSTDDAIKIGSGAPATHDRMAGLVDHRMAGAAIPENLLAALRIRRDRRGGQPHQQQERHPRVVFHSSPSSAALTGTWQVPRHKSIGLSGMSRACQLWSTRREGQAPGKRFDPKNNLCTKFESRLAGPVG